MPPMRSSEPSMTPWTSLVEHRDDRERERFDLEVELLVGEGKPVASEELSELIELGGLQRDGITGLNVHRQ